MRIFLAAAAALSFFSAAGHAQPVPSGDAWRFLQSLDGQHFSGCYIWKANPCHSTVTGRGTATSDGQALHIKFPGQNWKFERTADGSVVLKPPLWTGAMPLKSGSGRSFVFANPKYQTILEEKDGTFFIRWMIGGAKQAFGYSVRADGLLGSATPPPADLSSNSRTAIAASIATPSTPGSPSGAAVEYRLYGHLKPTDANRYLKYPITDAVGKAPYYLTVYSCAPQVDLRVRAAAVIRRDVRHRGYYVTTALASKPDRKFNFELDAGSDATVGFPFLVVGQVGTAEVDPAYLEKEGPICETSAPTEAEQERRFGDYYRALGKTFANQSENFAHDVRWLNPGFAIRTGCRTFGGGDDWEWCNQYSYDLKLNKVFKQSMYQPGDSVTLSAGPQLKDGTRIIAWQQDAQQQASVKAQRQSSGGGFLKVLQGAVGGLQGMADAGAGMSGALAGAAIGGVAGAAGVDAGMISNAFGSLEKGGSGGGLSTAMGGGGGNARQPVSMAGCDAVGVNSGNYQSTALSGGNDVQLKTMCGQAYEYYASYKRALAQGYSEADSNRTYDAHEKSALVANDFYANNRAN